MLELADQLVAIEQAGLILGSRCKQLKKVKKDYLQRRLLRGE